MPIFSEGRDRLRFTVVCRERDVQRLKISCRVLCSTVCGVELLLSIQELVHTRVCGDLQLNRFKAC